MSFVNVGKYDAGIIGGSQAPQGMSGIPTFDAAAVASNNAFLVSELEKRDPDIRKPLDNFTYPRDIVIEVGGGWADYTSAMAVAYGMTGSSGEGAVQAGGANGIPIVQASLSKGVYKAHVFAAALRVMYWDMMRSNFMGRSLESLLTDGVRKAYDKHMDQNTYIGFEMYGTTGLINNPDAVETTVATGAGGNTAWSKKTPQEILNDINSAISAVWGAANNDESAMPNHILMPYSQYTYLLNTPVSAEIVTRTTILDYIMENNVATKAGKDFFIGATNWCQGAGTGSKDRMVVYVNDRRFVKMEELVPLFRAMTNPNATEMCYDTGYAANVSETQIFYPQTIAYFDGI